uniref:Cell division protein n=1 Tax=Astrephomene gubernaculifera TaxID=47775 RepID=A0A7R6ULE7_9CHLO|nr:cell division protein [Astrephomene gubernaculifera]
MSKLNFSLTKPKNLKKSQENINIQLNKFLKTYKFEKLVNDYKQFNKKIIESNNLKQPKNIKVRSNTSIRETESGMHPMHFPKTNVKQSLSLQKIKPAINNKTYKTLKLLLKLSAKKNITGSDKAFEQKNKKVKYIQQKPIMQSNTGTESVICKSSVVAEPKGTYYPDRSNRDNLPPNVKLITKRDVHPSNQKAKVSYSPLRCLPWPFIHNSTVYQRQNTFKRGSAGVESLSVYGQLTKATLQKQKLKVQTSVAKLPIIYKHKRVLIPVDNIAANNLQFVLSRYSRQEIEVSLKIAKKQSQCKTVLNIKGNNCTKSKKFNNSVFSKNKSMNNVTAYCFLQTLLAKYLETTKIGHSFFKKNLEIKQLNFKNNALLHKHFLLNKINNKSFLSYWLIPIATLAFITPKILYSKIKQNNQIKQVGLTDYFANFSETKPQNPNTLLFAKINILNKIKSAHLFSSFDKLSPETTMVIKKSYNNLYSLIKAKTFFYQRNNTISDAQKIKLVDPLGCQGMESINKNIFFVNAVNNIRPAHSASLMFFVEDVERQSKPVQEIKHKIGDVSAFNFDHKWGHLAVAFSNGQQTKVCGETKRELEKDFKKSKHTIQTTKPFLSPSRSFSLTHQFSKVPFLQKEQEESRLFNTQSISPLFLVPYKEDGTKYPENCFMLCKVNKLKSILYLSSINPLYSKTFINNNINFITAKKALELLNFKKNKFNTLLSSLKNNKNILGAKLLKKNINTYPLVIDKPLENYKEALNIYYKNIVQLPKNIYKVQSNGNLKESTQISSKLKTDCKSILSAFITNNFLYNQSVKTKKQPLLNYFENKNQILLNYFLINNCNNYSNKLLVFSEPFALKQITSSNITIRPPGRVSAFHVHLKGVRLWLFTQRVKRTKCGQGEAQSADENNNSYNNIKKIDNIFDTSIPLLATTKPDGDKGLLKLKANLNKTIIYSNQSGTKKGSAIQNEKFYQDMLDNTSFSSNSSFVPKFSNKQTILTTSLNNYFNYTRNFVNYIIPAKNIKYIKDNKFYSGKADFGVVNSTLVTTRKRTANKEQKNAKQYNPLYTFFSRAVPIKLKSKQYLNSLSVLFKHQKMFKNKLGGTYSITSKQVVNNTGTMFIENSNKQSDKLHKQKKRKAKKQRLEIRRQKKRTRFYPRPIWIRYRMFLNLLKQRKLFYSKIQKFQTKNKVNYMNTSQKNKILFKNKNFNKFISMSKKCSTFKSYNVSQLYKYYDIKHNYNFLPYLSTKAIYSSITPYNKAVVPKRLHNTKIKANYINFKNQKTNNQSPNNMDKEKFTMFRDFWIWAYNNTITNNYHQKLWWLLGGIPGGNYAPNNKKSSNAPTNYIEAFSTMLKKWHIIANKQFYSSIYKNKQHYSLLELNEKKHKKNLRRILSKNALHSKVDNISNKKAKHLKLSVLNLHDHYVNNINNAINRINWTLSKTNSGSPLVNQKNILVGSFTDYNKRYNLWNAQKLRNQSKNNKTKFLEKQFVTNWDRFFLNKKLNAFYKKITSKVREKTQKLNYLTSYIKGESVPLVNKKYIVNVPKVKNIFKTKNIKIFNISWWSTLNIKTLVNQTHLYFYNQYGMPLQLFKEKNKIKLDELIDTKSTGTLLISSSVLLHLCALISLISISQVRCFIKFHLILLYKIASLPALLIQKTSDFIQIKIKNKQVKHQIKFGFITQKQKKPKTAICNNKKHDTLDNRHVTHKLQRTEPTNTIRYFGASLISFVEEGEKQSQLFGFPLVPLKECTGLNLPSSYLSGKLLQNNGITNSDSKRGKRNTCFISNILKHKQNKLLTYFSINLLKKEFHQGKEAYLVTKPCVKITGSPDVTLAKIKMFKTQQYKKATNANSFIPKIYQKLNIVSQKANFLKRPIFKAFFSNKGANNLSYPRTKLTTMSANKSEQKNLLLLYNKANIRQNKLNYEINKIKLYLKKTTNIKAIFKIKSSKNIFNKMIFNVVYLFQLSVRSISSFFEKPAEFTTTWIAYGFLVEWSSDLITIIPENVDIYIWNAFSKISREFLVERSEILNFNFGTLLRSLVTLGLTRSQLNILLSKSLFLSPHLKNKHTTLKEAVLINFRDNINHNKTNNNVQSIISNISSFAALLTLSHLLHRRILHLFDVLIETISYPDTDLITRQEKGTLFWDIWADFLVTAADSYNVNVAALSTIKAEQNSLVENISNDFGSLVSKNKNTIFSHIDGLKPSIVQKGLLKRQKYSNSNYYNTEAKKIKATSLAFRKGARLKNVASFAQNPKLLSVLANLNRWSVNQYITYQSWHSHNGTNNKFSSDLFIDYHPPKAFSHMPAIKCNSILQQPIGTLVCQIYSGCFNKQISKNVLLVNTSPDKQKKSNYNNDNLLLIQAIAGETELKIITDNAQRYALVNRGFAIGIKLLRDVFDAIALNTPCIFLLEDIHAIGERRPMLINDYGGALSDDTGNSVDFFGSQRDEVHEKNQVVYQLTRHAITHYKKPFKGDYSSVIPTNLFVTDLFLKFPTRSLRGKYPLQINRAATSNITKKLVDTKKQSIVNYKLYNKKSFAGTESIISKWSTKAEPKGTYYPNGSKGDNKSPKNRKATLNFAGGNTVPKNKTKEITLLPNKIVEELPIKGLPSEQLSTKPRTSYSVRAKVAMLAELSLSNLSAKLDMITDLLVIIDSVRSNNGFVVFATTDVPHVLDPALRRPGRLDETICLPNINNSTLLKFKTNYEIIKSVKAGKIPYLIHTNFSVLTNSYTKKLNLTVNLNDYNKNLLPNVLGSPLTSQKYGLNYALISHSKILKIKNNFNKESTRYLSDSSILQIKNKTKAVVYYEVGKVLLKYYLNNKNSFVSNIISSNFGIKSINYLSLFGLKDKLILQLMLIFGGKIGQLLGTTSSPSPYLHVWKDGCKAAATYHDIFGSNNNSSQTSLLSFKNPIKGVTFTSSNDSNFLGDKVKKVKGSNNDIKNKAFYFLSSKNNTWHDSQENLRIATNLILSFIHKRYLYRKNLIVPKLLSFTYGNVLEEPPGPPFSSLLIPAKRFENYKRALQDSIVGHKMGSYTEKQLLNKDGIASDQITTNINWYYQNRILKRHGQYLTNQWSNGQLSEHNAETVFLSDIDWRSSFIKNKLGLNQLSQKSLLTNRSINKDKSHILDVLLDFPDTDQYYNPQRQRWLLNKGFWSFWFDFDKVYSEEIISTWILESIIKTYTYFHNNTELLDFVTNKFIVLGNLNTDYFEFNNMYETYKSHCPSNKKPIAPFFDIMHSVEPTIKTDFVQYKKTRFTLNNLPTNTKAELSTIKEIILTNAFKRF